MSWRASTSRSMQSRRASARRSRSSRRSRHSRMWSDKLRDGQVCRYARGSTLPLVEGQQAPTRHAALNGGTCVRALFPVLIFVEAFANETPDDGVRRVRFFAGV